MFSLFGKKERKVKIIDRVFISCPAKDTSILSKINSGASQVVICWFEESLDKLKELLSHKSNVEICLAREVSYPHLQNRPTIFYEHYPLLQKEEELLHNLQLNEVIFYSALDEPLFSVFGGEKIIGMLQAIGMDANEMIEHKMISSSIKNAQQKISEKISFEITARSQAEWFTKNVKD